jgi:tricarballylate dehydrogenase
VKRYDVVVAGAGNAGLSAALAARERGATVLVLECAPYEQRGGNTMFTGGGYRFAYDSAEDITRLVPDLSPEMLAITDFGTYPADQFFADVAKVTEHRTDPDLAEIMVNESGDAVRWIHGNGVRFLPKYGRQAFKIDGRFTFWGGVPLCASGEGRGLMGALEKAAVSSGIDFEYRARARELITENGRISGVKVEQNRTLTDVPAGSVVLAAGGFEANAEWRTRYLGPGWDLAKVRGTQFNLGDGIQMALAAGAVPWGQWSGCHAVSWDLNAPAYGDRAVGEGFSKHSYPLGIIVNQYGQRFVDEGADIRNYTYAKYGRQVLAQPGQMAWQIFDGKVVGLLRDHYNIRQVSKVSGQTLEELAGRLDGIDQQAFLQTVADFNAAVNHDVAFNPNVKDGRCTVGLAVSKSNWAQALDTPPFVAYAVTCGITFTFGGVRINPDAQVLDTAMEPIPQLYAAGEMVGGIHYFNYAGGTGLTAGTVFGRRAGASAAMSGAAA